MTMLEDAGDMMHGNVGDEQGAGGLPAADSPPGALQSRHGHGTDSTELTGVDRSCSAADGRHIMGASGATRFVQRNFRSEPNRSTYKKHCTGTGGGGESRDAEEEVEVAARRARAKRALALEQQKGAGGSKGVTQKRTGDAHDGGHMGASGASVGLK